MRFSSHGGLLRRGVQILAVGAAYAVVGRLGLAIAPVHLFASLVWAPTGIALAVLLRRGLHWWPGVALGAFLVNAWTGAPAAVALGIGLGNTLEAVSGAYLVRRAAKDRWSLERPRDILVFIVLGALLSTIVSATVGVASLAAAGLVPPADLLETWRVWWLGDAAGALVIGPLLLAWIAPRPPPLSLRRRTEAAALGVVLVAGTVFVFFHAPMPTPTGFVLACMLIPLLIWGAARFEVRGATAAVFLASAIAVAGTASGRGPFVQESLSSSLLHQQAFMAIVAAAVLIVGAVTAERAAALRRCRRSEEALIEADRRKSEFLGVLSHELRNPLAPIRTGLHVLRRTAPGSEQGARALAVIDRQTDQLTRLVDDLLDVTRISRGLIQLHPARVELGAIVRDAVEDHRPLFSSRDVALDLHVEAGPVWIEADATRVSQITGNLLHNAAKFTASHGRVTVRVGHEGRHATVRVADDGVGIAPGLLPHVFEPFTQADASLERTRGGLGLGLALVKGLVQLHGGDVEARSEGPGRGSEFTLRLPAVDEPELAAERPAARAPPVARRRVLVIEDNVDAAESLKDGLELSGHEVFVAHDGQEGLARARSLRPEVVLCDIGLPGLDGYEVARRIRADPSLSPLLVAVTGYALPEDQRKAREAGFDRHLAKPFQFRDIEDALAGARSVPPARRRILVVDDDDAMRDNIREVLERDGWEVQEARNGAEALDAVTRFAPAVVLLDYRMPDMDGGELSRRLATRTASPEIVLLTAATHARELAMQHGVRFYVPKPFAPRHLLGTIAQAAGAG
ncbi:MAG TPA: MASE1 domain-containing protein [Anaeromyxobacter sp.]|nr:MASE1 domain-containing protein [Anaeromyxobacter sp.]